MKKRIFYISSLFALCALSFFCGTKSVNKEIEIVERTVLLKDTGNWNAFISALSFVESGNSPTKVGSNNDVGMLQITPIMVREANRIVGNNKYKLSDRTNIDKSVELFNVVQAHHNPNKDLNLALKIWNSKAPLSYHKKVINKYNELIKE